MISNSKQWRLAPKSTSRPLLKSSKSELLIILSWLPRVERLLKRWNKIFQISFWNKPRWLHNKSSNTLSNGSCSSSIMVWSSGTSPWEVTMLSMVLLLVTPLQQTMRNMAAWALRLMLTWSFSILFSATISCFQPYKSNMDIQIIREDPHYLTTKTDFTGFII